MAKFLVTLEGKTPLMSHRDNLEFKQVVTKWQRDPANRDKSVPGDDRSPAWGWIGSLYHDGKHVALPQDCVMASCMGAGAEMKSARGKKSLKAQTQSGMAFADQYLRFTVGGKPIPMDDVTKLMAVDDFDEHSAAAQKLGFGLDIRRVSIGTSKNVRVRPVFDGWQATGILNVWDGVLTRDVLETLLQLAGDKYGLLEWRPSARRPGPFGRFHAEIKATT